MNHCTWDALRALRWSGRKPKLPVIVTTLPKIPARFDGVGCMVILHTPGTKFELGLLEGLEVICFFDSCGDAAKVSAMMQAKGKYPARFESWCKCGSCLTVFPRDCNAQKRIDDWLTEDPCAKENVA